MIKSIAIDLSCLMRANSGRESEGWTNMARIQCYESIFGAGANRKDRRLWQESGILEIEDYKEEEAVLTFRFSLQNFPTLLQVPGG
jgi:hypothetical protein